MKISEKDRAQYLRLLRARDRANLASAQASLDVDTFFVDLSERYSQDGPFHIDTRTGEIQDGPVTPPAAPVAPFPVPPGAKLVAKT